MVVELVVARRSGGRRGRGRAEEKANLRGRPAIILVRASGGTCQLLRPGTEITDASYSIRRYRLAGRGWSGQIKKKAYVLSRATARENPACWAAIPDAALSNSRRRKKKKRKENIEEKSSREGKKREKK
ncbi:hypothetical protein TRV_06759 [Trichophyton verrucosum HKI 0517]|uniref:Uncharacterized protein n=1 Tax=Trichophyton verrucosum (strain HKI 0517) TaxID=663202 RepID=D4DHV2_TRIVH|nr:uncharacterized protein TRV_06759 [Trichophyton verrucosum HKI 0517]EFE38565.1 hypothetical protein TRV_06759 [Trichophyton verrucosum HKI 0517]